MRKFIVRTRSDAAGLAQQIAALTPRPERAELPLLELLLNAVEHGNLELGCAYKRELVRAGQLDAEIERRQALSPFDRRYVEVAVLVEEHGARFSITDEGAGFDWRDAAACTCPEAPNGRGVALVRAWADVVTYNDRGNSVTVELRW